jgi:hypothetical protein
MVVTLATSKKPDHTPIPDRITNYAVESSCPGSISDAIIRVNSNKIIDASYPSETSANGTDVSPGFRSFKDFGFNYNYLNIGVDSRGEGAFVGKDCVVKGRESFVNEGYDPSLNKYWFYKTGFFTKTTYDCFDQNNFVCSVIFEELSAGEFNTVNVAK